MTRFLAIAFLALMILTGAGAQPLVSPFAFSIDENVKLDNSLVAVPFEKAGVRGRVKLTTDGHLGFADGSRLRIVGTNLQWSGQWPDSTNAVSMAQRFRALGINCVRFNTFDVSGWAGGSIFADGPTTTGGGLSIDQMKKFDWFTHQLRENGVYYVFTFHSVWLPRVGDGVRQPDSLGWGARVPLLFDAAVQKIEYVIENETKKNKIHVIKSEIWGEDKEINKTFIFIRNLLWGFIYYGIYKLVGFAFELFFKFKKCKDGDGSSVCADASATNSILGKILCFPKMSVPPIPSMPSMPSMSNIMNQDVCSPECSPKHKGIGFSQFITNLNL